MAIPTYDEFIYPLLTVLGRHPEGVKSSETHEETADLVGLTQEERQELLPSGRQGAWTPTTSRSRGWLGTEREWL